MGGGADDPEYDHALRDDRIDNHRAEDTVVLPEILGHLRSLGDSSLDVDRGDASLGLSDVKAFGLETFLDSPGDLPALCPELVTFRRINYFHSLDVAKNQWHRQ